MASKSVLVVDDEQPFLIALENLLKRAGYEVMTTTNAEEGLIVAKDARPDIIVLDIMMPGMGGLAALKLIKSFPDLKNIPVILVSGATPLVRQADYKWAAFVFKPFSTEEFLALVARFLL